MGWYGGVYDKNDTLQKTTQYNKQHNNRIRNLSQVLPLCQVCGKIVRCKVGNWIVFPFSSPASYINPHTQPSSQYSQSSPSPRFSCFPIPFLIRSSSLDPQLSELFLLLVLSVLVPGWRLVGSGFGFGLCWSCCCVYVRVGVACWDVVGFAGVWCLVGWDI